MSLAAIYGLPGYLEMVCEAMREAKRSSSFLAALYNAQGKYEQAEPLYQRALAIREKQLGPEHPYTVVTRKNYYALVENIKRKGKEQH